MKNNIAVVTGASRGVGRGIAAAFGREGATVYVTGRTSTSQSAESRRGETIEETAEIVNRNGGRGIAVRCDHLKDEETAELFRRVARESGRLDVLVNNAWGGNELPIKFGPFWEMIDANCWDSMFKVGVRSHFVSGSMAARMMVKQRNGLILNTSFTDDGKYTGHFIYDLAKNAMNRMTFGMAHDLAEFGVGVIGLSPGFVRTELVLEHFGATEENWRAIKELGKSESPEYAGNAAVALALDKEVREFSGKVLNTGQLARRYSFTERDGTQPEPFTI